MSITTPALAPPHERTARSRTLPQPYPIGEIAPVLQAFEQGKKPMTLNYGVTPSEAVDRLNRNRFLGSRQVVFLVHGFKGDLRTDWMEQMKDAIITKEAEKGVTVTVILVGWGNGAMLSLLHYWQAAGNTQAVGAWLAKYVTALKGRGIKTWGIGHSLGAHVLGRAGRDSGGLGRITALDPAGPAFELVNKDKRLDPSAAAFVDVIHTDGYRPRFRTLNKFLPINHYGTLIPLGTIDFYPSHGYEQRACLGPAHDLAACSHLRAIELFMMSITKPDQFKTDLVLSKAPKFEDPVNDTRKGPLAQMGYYADKFHGKGNYYVQTTGPDLRTIGRAFEYGPILGPLYLLLRQ